jgi:hypothetical protein
LKAGLQTSREPLTFAILTLLEHLVHHGDIFGNLEVEHADRNEIRAVVEGMLETGARSNRPGGQNLVSNPRPLQIRHVADGFFGVHAPVVVDAVIIDHLFHLIGTPF